MKTYVLTVSRVFPITHKRKGQRTEFVCKILHTINHPGNGLYEICKNECATSCYRRMIPKKIHTIRANCDLWNKRISEVQNGNAMLSVRYWSGKPYNSKQVTICNLTKESGIGIQEMFFLNGEIFDPIIEGDDITGTLDLAKNDGLSIDDFTEWFKNYDLSKPMAIIHFTKFRY